jgi:hypothetical protein
MMEAASTSETLVKFSETTRRNNPEDSHLYTRRSENLISTLQRPFSSWRHFTTFYCFKHDKGLNRFAVEAENLALFTTISAPSFLPVDLHLLVPWRARTDFNRKCTICCIVLSYISLWIETALSWQCLLPVTSWEVFERDDWCRRGWGNLST